MPPKAVSFPAQNQSSESYGWNARQIVPIGTEELSRRGGTTSEEVWPSGFLNRPLLYGLPNRPTPSAIFDVLRLIELKLDTDDIPALPHVGIFHDTSQVGDMPQAR